MAKSTYSVVVIRKGREKDYLDFWIRKVEFNASGEKLHSDLVAFAEIVEAKNKQEAVALVKQMHAGFSVDIEATPRYG